MNGNLMMLISEPEEDLSEHCEPNEWTTGLATFWQLMDKRNDLSQNVWAATDEQIALDGDKQSNFNLKSSTIFTCDKQGLQKKTLFAD